MAKIRCYAINWIEESIGGYIVPVEQDFEIARKSPYYGRSTYKTFGEAKRILIKQLKRDIKEANETLLSLRKLRKKDLKLSQH